mgnify:CR=1 FL=1
MTALAAVVVVAGVSLGVYFVLAGFERTEDL